MGAQAGTEGLLWEAFFARVGNESWLAAKSLMDLDRYGVVSGDASQWIRPSKKDGHRDEAGEWQRDLQLDWPAWVAHVDRHGRGWSTTQWHLFDIVAGLTTGRPFNIVGVLDRMGDWEPDVWRILVEWGTGGNNRDVPGRCAAVARTGPAMGLFG